MLPQLTTRLLGLLVEMPNVSPGHTPLFPNPFEMRTGGVSHPFVMENVRR